MANWAPGNFSQPMGKVKDSGNRQSEMICMCPWKDSQKKGFDATANLFAIAMDTSFFPP